MKATEQKRVSVNAPSRTARPFFGKRNNAFFGGRTISQPASFLSEFKCLQNPGKSTSTKVADNLPYAGSRRGSGQATDKYDQEKTLVQRQKQPDTTVVKDTPSNPKKSSTKNQEEKPTRASKCYMNPEFPDFQCLTYALKLDIDENLWSNADHFFLAAAVSR